MLKNNPFGTWGVILGLIAFGSGLMMFLIGPIHTDTRTLQQKVVDKTVSFKDSIAAKFKGKEVQQTREDPVSDRDINKAIGKATIVIAFLSFVLAILSFLKREDPRYTATAVVLGGATLAFQFLLVALGIIIILVIILFVAGQFLS